MGKRFTKLVGIFLVAAMLLPLIPASFANSADGNPFDFSIASYYYVSGGVMKDEVINQVENLKDYYRYEGKDYSTGLKDIKYVTGSPAVQFVSFENNGGAWSSGIYVVKLVNANLSPEITLKSGNGGDWNIKFKNDGVYAEGYVDPEAELVISCNFSNKQGYLKIGGRSVSGKGRKELAVKFKNMSSEVIEIGGNKKTKVNGIYGYVRDNNAPYIKSVDVKQDGTALQVIATATEAICGFGDVQIFDEWDRTYVDVTVQNTRTGTGTTVLRAYIKSSKGNTITFEAPLGDWANKDYTVIKLSPSSLKTIDGSVRYSHRELIYNYEWMRGNYPAVASPRCSLHKSFNVAIKSTMLGDGAANALSLGNIARTMNKSFDNTTPSVTGVSLSVPGKIMNTTADPDKSKWDDDIKLSDLYAKAGDGVYFKVTTDEVLAVHEGIKLTLNVKDENGNQVVLNMKNISTIQTTYGVPQSVMEFGPMTVKEGYSVMEGYDTDRIMPISLTYTKAQDAAGHNLITSNLGKPAEQLYLDFTGPNVVIEKLDIIKNSPYASFKVDISDNQSGINGAPVVITLKGKSEAGFSFRYVVNTDMAAPTDPAAYTTSAQLAGDSTVQIKFVAHAQSDYTCYIHIMLEPGVVQTVDDISASASATDVLGNVASAEELSLGYQYDNVKPNVSITSLSAKYYTSSVDIRAYFEGNDYRNIVASQYIWLLDDDSVPTNDSEWQTAYISNKLDSTSKRYINTGNAYINLGDSKDHTVYIWVRMQDEYGNWSDIVGRSIDVYLSKPSTNVEVLTDTATPTHEPNVTVTGPDARLSDGTTAYTRITLTVGDTTYFRVVKTGESINVFDFDGIWYKGKISSGKFTGVEQVTDFTSIKQHYGEVKVTFESAYVSLDIQNNASVNSGDVSYVKDSQVVSLLYAGIQPEGVNLHKVSVDRFYAVNSGVYSGGVIDFKLDMTGSQLVFDVENLLIPDWKMVNVDTDRSYIVIDSVDGDGNILEECVRFTGISATTRQTITVPAVRDDGKPFGTGAYRFRIGIYQKGSDRVEEYRISTITMVLDAGNENVAGLWGYTISPSDDLGGDISVMADDKNAIQSFGVSANRFMQTYRDREFATYTAGVAMFQLYVGSISTAKTIYGIEVESTAGVRFWNAAANPSEADLEAYGFKKPEYNVNAGGENAQVYIGTYGINHIVESVPQGAAGLSMRDLYLTAGMNTFCCQTISSAGVVSPISYFYIYVTNTNPTLEVSVDSYVPSLRESAIEGQINVDSITYKIDEVFSTSGDVKLEVVQRNPINDYTPVIVNGVEYSETNDYGDIVVPLKVGDLVTIKMDSYSNTLDNATVLFVARDEYGAVTVVTPELGEEYRDGYYTNDENSVRFALYDEDPWKYSDIWTGITYNEPAEIYNGGDASQKLNGEDIDGKFVSYIYSNEGVLEIVQISYEDLYVNRYNIESNDVSLGNLDRWYDHYSDDSVWAVHDTYEEGVNLDLLDWENATIEISGDGIDGTVVLPYGADAPNNAGLLWFTYSESEGLKLSFADPITENEAELDSGFSRSYTIKVKDIGGTEHEFTGTEYVNYPVHYTDGGASLVYGTEYPAYGVDLNLKVFLEDGSNTVHTGMFTDGVFNGSFTDAYGNVWPISYEVTGTYYDVFMEFSTLEPTMNPVTVVITAESEFTIDDYDTDIVTVENNGTTQVTVTAKENTWLYIEKFGAWVDIQNIFTPSYYLSWNISDELVENGGEFAGPVTVTLMPDEVYEYGDMFEGLEYEVIDRYTENNPSFTFRYGDPTSYTFKAEDLAYIFGEEIAVFTEDVTVSLPVTIIETPPFIPGIGEEGFDPTDETGPEVQLMAYTQQNGLYINTETMLRVVNGEYSYLEDYYGYTVYETAAPRAATSQFVAALGWGSAYRFQLEGYDMTQYKFIIKDGLYGEAPAYGDESDVIDGVSLVGRQLTVTAPSAFTVFAVDENGFATAIPLDLANIGTAPVPGTVKVPVDGAVRIYLTEPVCGEGQSANDLVITPFGYEVKVDNDTESEFYGLNYITVAQNGIYNINYSYMYTFDADKAPSKIEGTVSERVIEIRSEKIYLVGSIKWSANATHSVTNSNITATMQFSQPVSAVQIPADFDGNIEVRTNGTILTVRYDANCDAVRLKVIAVGGTYTTIDLAKVTNIDKVAPTVSLKGQTLSSDGKVVTVTLSSDEKALFAKNGNYGTELDGGYEYTVYVRENGKYNYTFTDMAGNISNIEVVVDSIIEGKLTVEYSADGVTPVRDPMSLSLNIGDKIYVRANRDSQININGGEAITATANTWVELTVTEGMSGLWPIIRTADNYGNVVLGQLGQVKLPDIKAPVVALTRNIMVVKVGTSASELEALLRANITASDADPDLTYTFEYDIDLNVTGNCQVTYKVSDSSGNTASVNGILRVSAQNEPVVTINGELVVRDTIYVADGEPLMLSVELLGEPYSVVYKSGLKSVGQMKIGVIDLARNVTTADEILLPFEESGYYTVCIITQSRDYYRIQIYVE